MALFLSAYICASHTRGRAAVEVRESFNMTVSKVVETRLRHKKSATTRETALIQRRHEDRKETKRGPVSRNKFLITSNF